MILEYILDDCKMSVGMIVEMCWNCTEKTGITVIATNSYNISNLKLQALQSIVTISQIRNYKHWNNTFATSHITTRRRLSVDLPRLIQLEADPVVELSYPVPRNRERSLHTCAQDVQITRMATI
jgi:hypothetical protein